MSTNWSWLIARLSENSTWRGLITIATAAGVTLKPEDGEKTSPYLPYLLYFRSSSACALATAIYFSAHGFRPCCSASVNGRTTFAGEP